MEIVDEILRHLHLQGRVNYRFEESGSISQQLPDDDNFQVHCVLEGACQYRVTGRPDWIRMAAGDVLALPRGGATNIQNGDSDQRCASGSTRLRVTTPAAAPRIIVLGGKLSFAGQTRHPLISGLADVTLVRSSELRETGTRRHAGFLIDKALSDYGDHSTPILDRLFEILLIQVIRAYYASAGPAYRFMAALHDPAINHAIVAMHENPGFNWSLERLADCSGLSRSTFSRQFTEVAGIPAMHYLTLWRMHTALTRLKAGDRDLARVARELGYISSTAFQKAFKRVHGFTPAKAPAG